MSITFKSFTFSDKESSKDFFAWCLKNKLYKSTASKNYFSRLKYTYEGIFDVTSISAFVAFKEKKVIAICLCEHENNRLESANIGAYTRNEWKKEKEFAWQFINAGFLSVYVKPIYRYQGIAQELIKKMEHLRISDILNNNTLKEEVVPFFMARELAYNLVENKSNFSHAVSSGIEDKNYFPQLSMIVKKIEGIEIDINFTNKVKINILNKKLPRLKV